MPSVWPGVCTSSGGGFPLELGLGQRGRAPGPFYWAVERRAIRLRLRRPGTQAGIHDGGSMMRGSIRFRLPVLLVVALSLTLIACSSVGGGGSNPKRDPI